MKKRILLYCAIGFLVGMLLVMLIPAVFNLADDGTAGLVTPLLIARVGSARGALAVSFIVFGLYSTFCIGGMLLYEIESWPLALATAVHFLGIALGYVFVSLLLGWEMAGSKLLLIEGFMAIGFVLIWLIMYLRYKAEVRELNELQKKAKGITGSDKTIHNPVS